MDTIRRGIACNSPDPDDVLDVLSKLGGFDIAGLCGMFLGGALAGVPVLMDGFISGVAALCAVRLCPAASKAVFASHCSTEPAARLVLDALGKSLYARAEANRAGRTWTATTMDEVLERAGGENGYIKTMWCGNLACEEMMKEKAGLSSRCMPFAQEHLSDVCPCCGKPAKAMVVWGKAY
mgnify:CR=1 FL=1